MAKEDRRVQRTKKLIRKALASLIEEKGFTDISVTDLTARADINRGTFYLHYEDKYDMLRKIEEEILTELSAFTASFTYEEVLSNRHAKYAMPFLIDIFTYIKENRALFKAILGPKGDPHFNHVLKEYMSTNFYRLQPNESPIIRNDAVPPAYFTAYLAGAHLGIIQHWLNNDLKESPEEVALLLTKMFTLGPLKVSHFL